MDYLNGSQINNYVTQVNNMDYWSLVKLLMNQITPEYRKQILIRLTDMNDQLLSQYSVMNSCKKDLVEPQQSVDLLNFNLFNMHTYQTKPLNQTPLNQTPLNQYTIKKPKDEINLDDIFDDIQEVPLPRN